MGEQRTSVGQQRTTPRGDSGTGWFVGYAIGGGLVALGLLTITVPGLLGAVAVVAILAMILVRRGVGPSAAGIVAGLALPVLYVAWLNRGGPGNVCHGEECTDAYSPWPFVAVALVLVGVGVALFVTLRRRTGGRGREQVAASV